MSNISTSRILQSCLVFLAFSALLVSCKKDDPKPPVTGPASYTVPTTYSFANVSYTGQTQRIAMLDEISVYMSSSNTTGVVLDAQKLKDMYANANAQFTDPSLNTSGKQLKNKTFSLDQSLFDSYFDTIAMHSTSVSAGTNGTAGVVVSTTDPSKKYLQGANGIEYAQVIKKGLMGAVFYYQAMDTYLTNVSSQDNVTEIPGQGTAMEHYFDEAFGYFGAPLDFPSNTTGLKYWASYSNQVNASIGSNAGLMNAFLAGRAAISNEAYATRDANISVIRQKWETLVAAAAIHELNAAKTNLSDDALRNHYVSEAIGFVMSLKYNSERVITLAQISQTLDYIGYNIYNISVSDIDNARNTLSTIYGLDSVKDTL